MPEGDSIHRLALRLGPLLEGRTVTAFAARRISNEGARSLLGHRVESVRARGKNLLVTFDDGRVLHIHLRMHGRIFAERPRSAFWSAPASAPDLRLAVGREAIVGRNLPVCRLLTAQQARSVPDLASLGPDLVAPDYDEAEAVRRIRALAERTIAEALLVQRAAAGIGNVYKSEVLFLEGIDPHAPIAAVTDDELRRLLRRASVLLARNLGSGPRTTRPTLGGARLWVYGRRGKPCLRCGDAIRMSRQDLRSTYYCPRCQPARASAA